MQFREAERFCCGPARRDGQGEAELRAALGCCLQDRVEVRNLHEQVLRSNKHTTGLKRFK